MTELAPLTQKLIKDITRSEKDSSLSKEEGFVRKKENNYWENDHLLFCNLCEKVLTKIFNKKKTLAISVEDFLFEFNQIDFLLLKDERKKKELQCILYKYKNVSKNSDIGWFISIASCEIEELLSHAKEERRFLSYTYNSIKKSLDTDNELLYIAIQQTIFNIKKTTIIYHLLKAKNKDWENIYSEKEEIEKLFEKPLLKKVQGICRKKRFIYKIIETALKNNSKDIRDFLENPERIEKEIILEYEKKVNNTKSNLFNFLFITTVLILATRLLLLIYVEVPLIGFLNNNIFNDLSLTLSVVIPFTLSAFLALEIKSPPEKNRKKLFIEILKTLYKKDESLAIKLEERKNNLAHTFFSLFYTLGFLILFSATTGILFLLGLPLISSIILSLFASFISFIEVLIREKLSTLYVIEKKENFFNIITDIFAFPLLKIRKYFLSFEKKTLVKKKRNLKFKKTKRKWKEKLKEKKENIYKI